MTSVPKPRRRQMLWLLATAIALSGSLTAARAADDPHRLFEERCGRCHGHAGDFAQERLLAEGDMVRSRKTGEDIRPFLVTHFGQPSREELDLLTALFRTQVIRGGLYTSRCLICHDRARQMARLRLTMKDDRLVGRYSGRDIGSFLESHGRLTAEEREIVFNALHEHTAAFQ